MEYGILDTTLSFCLERVSLYLRCLTKVEMVEMLEHNQVEACEHSYDKTCHTTYVTTYSATQVSYQNNPTCSLGP
jgi:hypothetical protein